MTDRNLDSSAVESPPPQQPTQHYVELVIAYRAAQIANNMPVHSVEKDLASMHA